MTTRFEPYGRLTQYLQSRGLPAAGGGPAGTYARNLFKPYESLFNLEERFSPVTGAGPGTFSDYLGRMDPGAATRSGAEDLLGRLYDAGAEKREATGLGFGDLFGEGGVPIGGSVPAQAQADLMNLALRRQFGRLGAQHIAGRLGTERGIFSQQQAQAAELDRGWGSRPNNFLDYLREKYNINPRMAEE